MVILIWRVWCALAAIWKIMVHAMATPSPNRPATSDLDRAANVDVILTHVKDAAATQNAQIAALDGKANFGLTAASLLTTGVATLHGVDPNKTAGIPVLPHLPLVMVTPLASIATAVAFALYLYVVFSAYNAYKVRAFTSVPDAKALLSDYWNTSSLTTKSTLAATIADAIADNRQQVESKATWVDRVMLSLLIEAVVLLLLLILQLSV